MSQPSNSCYILGISGGSGSGKTTFAILLREILGKERCEILYQDSYYIDQSAKFDYDGGRVNFDHPDSLDFDLLAEHLTQLQGGKEVQVPIYDFKTHKRLQRTVSFDPKPLVILDGILILSQQSVRAKLHTSVFIDTHERLRFERRITRDVRDRGRTVEGVEAQYYAQVKPMHDQFVEPSKAHADKVYSGEGLMEPLVWELLSHMGFKV